MKKLEEISLSDITPYRLGNDPVIKGLIPPVDEALRENIPDAKKIALFREIDTLSPEILNFLAVQFHIDFYDLAANDNIRRELVKNALLWHMHKGTKSAIISALKSIGIDGEFLHWHDTGDEPYTFRIKAEITGDFYRTIGRDKIISSIYRVVNESKSARSHFAGLETNIHFSENIPIYAGAVQLLAGHRILTLSKNFSLDANNLYAGIFTAKNIERKIFPVRVKIIDGKIYSGIIMNKFISHELGVNKEDMQELISQFEKRNIARLEQTERNIKLYLEDMRSQIFARMDKLEKNLQWQDENDEEFL